MKLKILGSILALAAIGLVTTGAYAQTPTPTTPPPAPTELVYLPQLPTVAMLIANAKAEGATIVKIDQKGSQTDVTYKDANGQVNVVSYQLLPAAEAGAAQATAGAPVPTPPPTVVYRAGPQPIYYGDPYYYGDYYPYYWWPAVSVGLGFGWYHGWGGHWGGYHGGWHGHR
jgi:hypothetical protein